MWSVQSEKIKQEKERVNLIISKHYRERFRDICKRNGIIMSVFIEKAIKRYVEGR